MHAPPQRRSGEGAATEPQLKRGQKPTRPKSPLGPTWTSLSRLIEQVKDALVVRNQPLRYVAPLRRMQGIIFRGADKLPEWGPESAHSNRGAFCKVTSTVGVIFASLSAFEFVSESVDVALTS